MNPRFTQAELFGHLQKSGTISKKTREVSQEKEVKPPDMREAVLRPLKAHMFNPYSRTFWRKGILEPNKRINYRTLRYVSEKAWLINAIIAHKIRQMKPFLKEATKENDRGFQIKMKAPEKHPGPEEKKRIKAYTDFFLNTGFRPDPEREDNIVAFTAKALRDIVGIDAVATEIQRSVNGKPYAFWALDPATIKRCTEEGYNGDDRIKFVQEIDMKIMAFYTRSDLVYEFMNPRSDIEHFGYGYSLTEQAIDLITALINTFAYNMGVFTDDNLPRGMIMLNGDADVEDVEAIEEYMVSIMSGGPQARWRIPIIPSGGKPGERALEWVSFDKNNTDMQFSMWTEFIWSGVAALAGTDLEELGIRTQKSTTLLGENVEPKIEASKSRSLGDHLSFMQQHFQKILEEIDLAYKFEFVGYERDDPTVAANLRESDLRTFTTIDMIMAEKDLPPFNQEWSKIPLNPYVVQMVQADKQAQQQQEMAEQQAQQGVDPEQEQGANQDLAKQFRDLQTGAPPQTGQPKPPGGAAPKPGGKPGGAKPPNVQTRPTMPSSPGLPPGGKPPKPPSINKSFADDAIISIEV
jgi:hypothetical protein